MNRKIDIVIIALTLCWPVLALAQLNVVYPAIEERASDNYGYKILDLALSKSGRSYHLSVSPLKMNQQRARASMADGSISIFDTGTSAEFEDRFRAIYFPIDRGISGYRLFIINKRLAPEFAAIKNIDGLRKETAGQGPGWADIKILQKAGINVQTAEFKSLFTMVEIGRFDFFPLGIEEIYPLLDQRRQQAPNSVVEQTLALHYPFARLFFVRKDNKELHDAVMAGLELAFVDGSLQKLMDNDDAFKAARLRANLANRTIIEVDNPNLTQRFKEMPSKYFALP